MSFFLSLGNKLFKEFNYTWISDDMKRSLPVEVNFLNEIKNIEKLKSKLHLKKVYTPKIYKNLSTSKVLVMEFINGYPITDTDKMK